MVRTCRRSTCARIASASCWPFQRVPRGRRWRRQSIRQSVGPSEPVSFLLVFNCCQPASDEEQLLWVLLGCLPLSRSLSPSFPLLLAKISCPPCPSRGWCNRVLHTCSRPPPPRAQPQTASIKEREPRDSEKEQHGIRGTNIHQLISCPHFWTKKLFYSNETASVL